MDTLKLHPLDDPDYRWELLQELAPAQWRADIICTSDEELAAAREKIKASGYAFDLEELGADKKPKNSVIPSQNGYLRITISADNPVNFRAFEAKRDPKDVAMEYITAALQDIAGRKLIFDLTLLKQPTLDDSAILLRSALKVFGIRGQALKTASATLMQADIVLSSRHIPPADELYKGIPLIEALQAGRGGAIRP